MREVQVHSIGVIPVSRSETGEYLFLVVKHRAGHWSFPKGTPEEGESEIETARRELCEETGIKNIDIKNDKQFTQAYSFIENGVSKHKTVTYYIGLTDETNTKTASDYKHEIPEIRWLPYEEAHELLTYKESRCTLEEAHEFLLTLRNTTS